MQNKVRKWTKFDSAITYINLGLSLFWFVLGFIIYRVSGIVFSVEALVLGAYWLATLCLFLAVALILTRKIDEHIR
jgi:hypothetical protein